MDDNAAMMGDWIPPSPTSKLIFSSFLEVNDPINYALMSQLPDKAKQSGISFENNATLTQLPDFNRGLSDRIAARGGFSAPRVSTESIRSSDHSSINEVSNNEVKSPYITISPGISPTALLESPVFLSNSLTQESPTTGKYPFYPTGNLRGTSIVSNGQSKDDFFDDLNGSSFEFKPHQDPSYPFSLGIHAVPNIDVTVRSENTLQNFIASQIQSHSEFPQPLRSKDQTDGTLRTETRCIDTVSATAEHSPQLSEQHDDEGEQQIEDDTLTYGTATDVEDDGYNWRKYGQKQVKGSEFPRSYFKCTHITCLVKKKVERSREGDLTEIIYTGEHNHPKPTLNRRSSTGSNQFDDTDGHDNGGDNRPSQWIESNNNSLMSMNSELRAVDPSSTFSNEGEDVSANVGSASIVNDVQRDESESKRRRIETYAAEIGSGATRAVREPRVVVQTASDVDILDDGYRWRKYGQKVVKGNPNPRSYYKCTSVGCTVRKHVERASHDLKSVITTYEGKHNHDVPPARNSSHVNTTTSAAFATPSQVRYERAAHLNSFNMPMMHQQQQQQQPFMHLPMGLNQASVTNLSMAGLGHRPVHPYIMQRQQVNDMGITMPKMEHNSEPNLSHSNGSSVYQQIMNRKL